MAAHFFIFKINVLVYLPITNDLHQSGANVLQKCCLSVGGAFEPKHG